MDSVETFGELTPQAIGARIAIAIEQAPEPFRANHLIVAGTLRINPDTLKNYITGDTAVGAITICKLAQMTQKPVSWFAGIDRRRPSETFAVAADNIQIGIVSMRDQLDRLERELRDARKLVTVPRLDPPNGVERRNP